MRAVKFLVKLCDMRPEYGNITAFENYTNHVYVGTSTGCLLYLQVEGLMEYDMRATETVRCGDENGVSSSLTSTNTLLNKSNDKLNDKGDNIENETLPETIYTSLLAFTRFSELISTPITQIQHCQSHPVLFVLSNQCLCAFNASDLTYLFDVPGCIGAFFIYPIKPNSTGETGGTLPFMACTYSTTSSPSVGCLTEETATHVICAAQHSGKSLFVYEIDLKQGKNTRPVLKQELQLPEPVLTLVAQDGAVCIGMRREYSVVFLTNGLSKGILTLHGASHFPLLALGECGGVYMRYHNCVFTTPMQCALTTSTPYSVLATSASNSLPPGAALPTTSAGTPLRGRVYYLRDEVRAMVSQFPFFFAFYADYCDVFSVFEEEPIESLPLPGVYFAPKPTRGQRVFVAGAHTLWMATVEGIRHQLMTMVERFKIEEAFELLASYQRDTRSSQLELEEELKKKAGIACLKRARPHMAMRYFGETISPKELAVHLPECLPLPSLQQKLYSEVPQDFLQRAPPRNKTQVEVMRERLPHPECTTSLPSLQVEAHDREDGSKTATTNGGGGNYQNFSASPTCEDQCWCSSWNLPVGGLERAWLETYETFPFVPSDVSALSYHIIPRGSAGCGERQPTQRQVLPSTEEAIKENDACKPAGKVDGDVSSTTQPLNVVARQVPNMGCVNAKEFTVRCWQDFEDAILEYFSFRLSKLWKEIGDTATIITNGVDGFNVKKSREICKDKLSAAQVMEYVLLVLALKQQDDRGVYRVVSMSIALQVEDCYNLLVGLGEYRILSCLLFRRGFVSDALALLRSRVYISSYFSPNLLPIQPDSLSSQGEVCKGDSHQESFDFLVSLLLNYWQQQHCITISPSDELETCDKRKELEFLSDKKRGGTVSWIPVLAHVACGVWCLPRVSRGRLLSRLLGITIPPMKRERLNPSVHGIAIGTASHDLLSAECFRTETDFVAMISSDAIDSWARPLAEFYANGIQEVTGRATYIQYDGGIRGRSLTSVDGGGASPEVVPHVGPLELVCNFNMNSEDTSDAKCPVRGGSNSDTTHTANSILIAPNSLSEIFFLVDKMNLFALKELLFTHPEHALCRDEEGCTALHVAFGQIMQHLKGMITDPHAPKSHATIGGLSLLPPGDATLHGRDGKQQNLKDNKAVLLELLLPIALLLVNAGCPTTAINRYGMSCFDLLAAAGGNEYVEIVASALAAALEVNMVSVAVSAVVEAQ